MLPTKALGFALSTTLLAACASPPLGGVDSSAEAGRASAEAGAFDAGDAALAPDAALAEAGRRILAEVPGLRPLGFAPVPGDHCVDALLLGDYLFAATSNEGFKTYRRTPAGMLVLAAETSRLLDRTQVPRCTTIAVHQPSHTLYCAAGDQLQLASFDVSDPGAPAPRGPTTAVSPAEPGYRRVVVLGDTLYLAAFDRGLLRAPIMAGGALGAFVPTGLGGSVLDLAGEGDRLVALVRERGLVQLRAEADGSATPVGSPLLLEGPLLRLAVEGGRAAVALGSRGFALVDLTAAGPVLRWRREPETVVEAVALSGARLLAGTNSGPYLYDLSEPQEPRLAGFQPTAVTTMQVLFAGELGVSVEWRSLTTYQLEPAGSVLEVENSPGYVVPEGHGVALAVRNPGDRTLTAAVFPLRSSAPFVTREVGPGQTAELELSAALLEQERRTDLSSFRVGAVENIPYRVGAEDNFVVLRSTQLPALGQPFPSLRADPGAPPPAALPLPGRPTRVVFLVPDCVQQWFELEELAWLNRRAESVLGATPVVLFAGTAHDGELRWEQGGFMPLWGAQGLTRSGLPQFYGSLGALPTAKPADVFAERFSSLRIRGPDVTADYSIDAAGRVVNFERNYRGLHPLPVRVLP